MAQENAKGLLGVPSAACACGKGSLAGNNNDKSKARLKHSKSLRGLGAEAFLDSCGTQRARRDAGGWQCAGPPSAGECRDASQDHQHTGASLQHLCASAGISFLSPSQQQPQQSPGHGCICFISFKAPAGL